jgi:predicted phosphodiesterase/uncharacterized membrane protein
LRWVAWTAAVLALAVAGIVLGLRLQRPVTVDTALGSVSVRVTPAWSGSVDAFVPLADWGIRADAFDAPFELHVEPRRVDRQALIHAAGGDRRVLRQAEQDARDAAGHVLATAILWAAAGALALGAVAALAAIALGPGRLRALLLVVLTPLAAVVLMLAAVERARDSFDVDAFEQPSFYARGAELSQLLKVAETAQSAEVTYRNSVQRTLAGYATLLAAGGRFSRVETETPSVLVSDLHANVVVLNPLGRLFSAGPVFFAGDFGQRGTRAEAKLIVPRVTDLGHPLVAVSGNHDSTLIMRRLARAGAIVLTEHGRLNRRGAVEPPLVRRVAGLRVAGYQDPLEWRGDDPSDPRRVFSFAERTHGDQEYARARDRIYRWFARLRPVPDVVLIHQNGLAQALARRVQADDPTSQLVILTGHDHRQHVDLYGGVTVVDAGTTGAGGLFGVGTTAVGIAPLHFAGAHLRAIDLVQVEPISGAAKAERVIPESPSACEIELVRCHPDQP